MRPKDYLSQVRHIDNEIDSKIKLLEDLRARAMSIGSFEVKDKVQSSGGLDFSDWMDRYVDLQKEVTDKVDELIDLKQRIISQIDKVENPVHRLVLVNHYLRGMSLRKIAANYTYNYSYIKNIHGHALLEFKAKNPEVFKWLIIQTY